MTAHTLDSWDWAKIDAIDLLLDSRDKNVGLSSLSENPYPFLTDDLVLQKAGQVVSLKTASIETISKFGDALKNLMTLEHTIRLGAVNGVSYHWVEDHAHEIEGIPSAMVDPLKSWARSMIEYDSRATNILTNVLEQNQTLNTVNLQLQDNHGYQRLVSKLASLQHLKSLTIGGTDLHDVDDALLESATETVLDILQRCRSLDMLVFRPIPIQQPVLQYQAIEFTCSLTILDLSGTNRSQVGGPNMDVDFPFHVHRILPHCPRLKGLSLPRCLPAEEFDSLTPVLSPNCPQLGSLYINETELDVLPFAAFMASIGTLSRLTLTDCRFRASDFQPWLGRQDVRETLRMVFLEYDRIEQSPQSGELMAIMPSGGTVDPGMTNWFR